MLKIKTNKTGLYMLVSDYEKLPLMHETWFHRTPPEYRLAWVDKRDRLQCKAFITVFSEQAQMFITKKDRDTGELVSTELYTPTTARLRELGMLDETATAAEPLPG